MEPFLKPLSAQEEKSCLDAYQRGDTKARDILVERNLRLVAHVVKKYQGLPDDLDDLISIGTIGLIKAVMNQVYGCRNNICCSQLFDSHC